MSSRKIPMIVTAVAALAFAPMGLSPERRSSPRRLAGASQAPIVIHADSQAGVARPARKQAPARQALARKVPVANLRSLPGQARSRQQDPASPSDRKPSMAIERLDVFEAPRSASIMRPNALSLEFLGRGGAFSLNYDRALGDSASLGIGFSRMSATVGPVSASIMLIPIYTNLYFAGGAHRPYVTAGATIVSADAELSDLKGSSSWFAIRGSGALPNLGLGYEYRAQGGLLFRLGPYVVAVPKPMVWGGLTMGGTF